VGQQVYFIELLGANVNLGNIAPNEVIALEATRIGLRGDTFSFYLDK
jgi:phosphosulfolactate synthase